ncbi:cardiolipin synthase ClsB [Ideonella sp. DXS29W]|uniref:Cardiolipin synthase B n=1 Tax=Ideonella lacteola TaxID=2984193 RepID=A0ABU9BM65_9BURK
MNTASDVRSAHPAAWYALPQPQYLGGNDTQLLRGGDEYFPALIARIDRATHEVWLATYIFHHDTAAEAVAAALARAARRGVRVRVVVDGFGTHKALPQLQRWLDGSGASLVIFRPLERWWNWLQPGQLRRLHTKLCVVDGSFGFVGGINIIDDRNDLNHGLSEAPRLDFAVSLAGPVVAPIEQTVRAMWTRAAFGHDWRAEVASMARSAEPLTQARRLLRRLRILPALPPAEGAEGRPVRAAFVVRDNLRQRRSIERAYIEAIRGAARRVDIVCPYFYPGRAFRRTLIRAARRGVRVRLLLQGKLDYRMAGLAARVLYDELLAEGVQIYEYQAAFLHAKAAVIDDEWATVGSSNIDPLSLLLNLEANVAIHDEGFAGELLHAFETALTQSQQITVAPYQKGAWAVLGRGFVAWAAHWYLRMAGLSGRY